jgi:hypothetical protein
MDVPKRYEMVRTPRRILRVYTKLWMQVVYRQNAVAQVHIHTVIADPKPARKDIELCRKIRLPMFVISGKGIWTVHPDGKVVHLYDSDWYRPLKKNQFRRM